MIKQNNKHWGDMVDINRGKEIKYYGDSVKAMQRLTGEHPLVNSQRFDDEAYTMIHDYMRCAYN